MRAFPYLSQLTGFGLIALLTVPLGALPGNLVVENIPEFPPALEERLQAYQSARSAAFQAWNPGGEGMIILTRFGETTQIHEVAFPGASRSQLTFFREPAGGVRIPPGRDRQLIFFSRDSGGDENFQLFRLDRRTGQVDLITDGTSRHGGLLFSPDGEFFTYYSTRRNGRDWDLFLGQTDRPESARPILEEGGFWTPMEFSPNGQSLLVSQFISVNDSSRWLLDLSTGDLTRLSPENERVGYGPATWSKDGRGIYWVHDRYSEFRQLFYLDLETGEETLLTEAIPWNIEQLRAHPTQPLLFFTANEAGISRLYQLQTEDDGIYPVPGIPTGLIGRMEFDPTGQLLALNLTSAQTPGDAYALELGSWTLEPWTQSEVGGLRTADFVMPELIHYPTFDKDDEGNPRLLSAFLYQPSRPGPHPVVIQIHGGPESQSRPGFSAIRQFWVEELGLALLAPNVRGSTGYGKTFVDLDNGFLREDAVRDIGTLLDWIETREDLDSERVAVYGGSYGGYMVLASMIHFGQRLRAGVNIVGISDFLTFLKNTGDYRRDLRRVEYGDERDPEMREFLQRISPVNNADRIQSPLFIVQGYNDPRVPVGQAQQILEAVRANGLEPWYLLAMDEGHGFRRRSNADFFTTATVLFFQRYLLGGD